MKIIYPSNDNKCFTLWLFFLLLAGSLSQVQAEDSFVPGAGGALPTFTEFQPIAGHVGGFLVYSSVRHNNWFVTGTYAEVNMSFPNAAELGAETLVLQYKKSDGSWANLLNNENEITTTGDNFSLELSQTYTLRLLLRGGVNNGYVSNEQTAELAQADTYFSLVNFDESMYLTGVMTPWVGRGMQVSYIVKKLSDGNVVEGGLTYQWYRVNPATFEKTLIPGADSLMYATTTADIGYKMLVEATGNQTTVGGFYNMMSNWSVVIPNKCYVSNQTTSGFTLNLYKDVVKLDTSDFILRDKNYTVVPITSINKSTTDGIFQISAPMSLENNPYRLVSKSNCWKICTEMFFGQFSDLMEGVSIDLTANSVAEIDREVALNMMYDAANKQVRYESTSKVKSVSMYSLAGSLIGNWKVDKFEGCVPVGNITPGVYALRFTTDKGSLVRKVMVR